MTPIDEMKEALAQLYTEEPNNKNPLTIVLGLAWMISRVSKAAKELISHAEEQEQRIKQLENEKREEGNSLIEYIELLLQLHNEDIRGKNESKEAYAIRDKMYTPYKRLSPTDIRVVETISMILYFVKQELIREIRRSS